VERVDGWYDDVLEMGVVDRRKELGVLFGGFGVRDFFIPKGRSTFSRKEE
jgi:hypothetical protein